MAGRFELSPTPAHVSPRVAPLRPVHQTLGERCTSPISATELRPEHPADCPIPSCAFRCASRPSRVLSTATRAGPAFGQWPPVSPQVKPRLTAKPQLQPDRNPPLPARPGYPDRDGGPWCHAVLAELRSNAPHALHLPAAAFSTASRACDVASDALCRGSLGRSGLSAEPSQ